MPFGKKKNRIWGRGMKTCRKIENKHNTYIFTSNKFVQCFSNIKCLIQNRVKLYYLAYLQDFKIQKSWFSTNKIINISCTIARAVDFFLHAVLLKHMYLQCFHLGSRENIKTSCKFYSSILLTRNSIIIFKIYSSRNCYR